MVRVRVSHIARGPMPGGEMGCRIDFILDEPKEPQVVPQVTEEDLQRDPSKLLRVSIQGTVATLREIPGLMPPQEFVKIVLYLTMKEYKNMGSPGINEEFEADFYSSAYTVAPPLEETGSFIRLRRLGTD